MKEKTKTMQIGKQGITENVLGEIKKQLKDRKALHIRLLRSAKGDKNSKELAEEVAKHVKAHIVDVRGNTFTLEKK